MFGFTQAWIEPGFGSFNLIGAWPDAVSPYMTLLMGICILAMYAAYACLLLKNRKTGGNADCQMIVFGCGALLSILLFLAAGLVFSAQYVLWAIPFIMFLLMLPIGEIVKKRLAILSAAFIVLTLLNFIVNIYLYGAEGSIGDPGLLIILARNIVLLIMAYYVLRIAWNGVKEHGRSSSGHSSDRGSDGEV
jgi:hypothetical protein